MILSEPESFRNNFSRRCILCNGGLLIRIALSITLLIFIFLIIFYNNYEIINVVQVNVAKRSEFVVNERFLSFALDTSVLQRKLHNFNTTDPKLITMLKELSPAFFRIGGKLQDRLHFSANDSQDNFFQPNMELPMDGGECAYENICTDFADFDNFTFTGSDWLKLGKLAEAADVRLIFGLNALIRFDNNTWDYRNAESMIKFSNDHNLSVDWELGNEPNSFPHVFNYWVPPEEMGYDFGTLRDILKKFKRSDNAILFGPDVTRPRNDHKESMQYLKDFLQYGGEFLDIVTWHQYYFNGRTAKSDDFLNPEIFNLFASQADIVNMIVHNYSISTFWKQLNWKLIWLGETSSAYGGGAPGLSDRFISTFIWLDKLGLAAKLGMHGVIRQSIFNGHYALIDDNYNPNPDWWVSVLYKRLVGTRTVPLNLTVLPELRFYCHCAKINGTETENAIVFGMNLSKNNAAVRVVFSSLKRAEYVFEYLLTTDSLFVKNVFLNGKLLQLTAGHQVPKLEPRKIPTRDYYIMPPHSIVFWIFPYIKVEACQND